MGSSNTKLPFLKWAGGKRWLVNRHKELFPIRFRNYFEPFVGGGAVFFALNPKTACLSDTNIDLVNTYLAIKGNWRVVVDLLLLHQASHGTDYYYEMRLSNPTTLEEKAAKFIYLNRACWNGLYRVNLKGIFNVPKGTKTQIVFDTDDFAGVSESLKDVSITAADFERQVNRAIDGDFVFIDPPYTVKHNHNGFLKYNEKLFSWNDQIRLRDSALRAISRGAKVMITNAAHDSTIELYNSFQTVEFIDRHSVLAGDPFYRSQVQEMVARSW